MRDSRNESGQFVLINVIDYDLRDCWMRFVERNERCVVCFDVYMCLCMIYGVCVMRS